MHSYQDHNEVIQLLSDLYPKCFFADPKQRRPLKANIVDDLEKETDQSLAGFNIRAAVDWYTGHIGYDYACAAGAKRINLEGKEVGTVTETEARGAQSRRKRQTNPRAA